MVYCVCAAREVNCAVWASRVKSGAFSSVKYGKIVFAYKVFKYVTAGVSLIAALGWVLCVHIAHEKYWCWDLGE